MTPLKHAKEDRSDQRPQKTDAWHETALVDDFDPGLCLAQAPLVHPLASLKIGRAFVKPKRGINRHKGKLVPVEGDEAKQIDRQR